MALDTYTRVTDNTFVVNPFFGVGEKVYPFQKIRGIELIKSFRAPDGDVIRNWHQVLKFRDGSEYNYRKSRGDFTIDRQQQLVDYITRTGELKTSVEDPYPG